MYHKKKGARVIVGVWEGQGGRKRYFGFAIRTRQRQSIGRPQFACTGGKKHVGGYSLRTPSTIVYLLFTSAELPH